MKPFVTQWMRLASRQIAVLPHVIALLLLPTSLNASPWVDTGDERTRHHLTNLNDSGAITLSLTTWPLPWSSINEQLDRIDIAELNNSQMWSYQYIRHELLRAKTRAKSTKKLYTASNIVPFSSFSSDTTSATVISSANTFTLDWIAANLEIQRPRNPIDDEKYRFDGSYLATTSGNWSWGLDSVSRWWGPGWHSSLILSNNSRPAPGLFIKRQTPRAAPIPILSLAGPWSVEVIAKLLEKERAISQPKLLGSRLTFSPMTFVQLGYSRLALWGGAGYLENIESLADIVLGQDVIIEQQQDNGFADIRGESNQLISYDIRLSTKLNAMAIALYGQYLTNERQLRGDRQTASMLGLESNFDLLNVHSRVIIERSDTRKGGLSGNNPLYGHSRYPTGYRFKGRVIGESADTNTLKLSISGQHYLANGHQIQWRIVNAEFNKNGGSRNIYSTDYLDQTLWEIGYKLPANNTIQIGAGLFALQEKMVFPNATLDSGAYAEVEFRF